ncbi:uncharacterized protein LOC126672225 [Mercurialis annua]|uniref:uncharacterized protein LOC126672225 n=1 Tax=Mercurialis annua TaxID=3986 RepID=UPI00215F9A85|nr:uncharacterized protein LOC126672225 [Mercurialis annua]
MEEGLVAACSQLRLTEDEQETITLEDVIDENAEEKAELSLLDKNRILRDGPWNFDKQLILFEPMSGNMQPNNMVLNYCPVWVRIYNLPMNCRGRAAVSKIGSKLGKIVEVDGNSGDCNRYGRVRVNLDVSKPMIRGTKVINPLGEQCWIPFKYERLQNFCYWCGMLDHLVADCEEKPRETEVSDWPYGPGLRATPCKRSLMGNRQYTKPVLRDLAGQTMSGSHSDNGEGERAARRSLNLNDNTVVDSAVRVNFLPQQQVVNHVHGEGDDIIQAVLNEDGGGIADGLVEVCVQQIQPGEGSRGNVKKVAAGVQPNAEKKHGKEGSWTRSKVIKTAGPSDKEGTKKKLPTKRDRSMTVGEDSIDLFSKKFRDGLSDQFENIEISVETGEQSRRTQ